jgi:hypothetical protein
MPNSLCRQSTHTADWCPTCEERTSLTDRGTCPFCDSPLVVKAVRGGWTRPDLQGGKYTEAQLRVMYRAHIEQGMSINQLAKRTHAKVGYKSHHSAATRISEEWQRLGLPARDRIEATRLASTTHGHGARDRDERAYREFLRDMRGWNSLQGPGRPNCKGVKRQPPGQGQPCSRHALEGSDYCYAHDPARELERQAHTAKMRRRLPAREMLPMEPFTAWLLELLERHCSMREVAILLDGPYTALCQYVRGYGTDKQPKAEISKATVERYATAAGTTVEAIYSARRERIAA